MRHIARAKLLVMAPDICQFQGSTTKALPLVDQVLEAASSEGVPVVFALSRRGIGQVGSLVWSYSLPRSGRVPGAWEYIAQVGRR